MILLIKRSEKMLELEENNIVLAQLVDKLKSIGDSL